MEVRSQTGRNEVSHGRWLKFGRRSFQKPRHGGYQAQVSDTISQQTGIQENGQSAAWAVMEAPRNTSTQSSAP